MTNAAEKKSAEELAREWAFDYWKLDRPFDSDIEREVRNVSISAGVVGFLAGRASRDGEVEELRVEIERLTELGNTLGARSGVWEK